MHKRYDKALRIFTAAMVVAGYLALTATNQYGYRLLLLPLFALPLAPLGESLDRRYPWYRQLTTHITVACVVFVMLYIAAMVLRITPFDLLAPVTLLIMYIQVYELFHVKEERNYLHIFLMSFFMLVSAAVQSPSAAISLALLLFLIASVGAFTMLQVCFRGKESNTSGEAIILSLGESGEKEHTRTAPTVQRSLGVSVALTTVAALLLTFGVFFATPRTEAGLIGARDSATHSITGLGDMVSVGIGGSLEADPTPVMRVWFPDEPDGQYHGPMLWRTATFDDYTGHNWTQRGAPIQTNDRMADVRLSRMDDAALRRTRTRPDSEVEPVYQFIRLEGHDTNSLPALSKILMLHAPGERVWWDASTDFTVGSEPRPGFEYHVVSEVAEPSSEALRAIDKDYADVMRLYELNFLTRHNLQPRTVSLTEEILEGAPSVYDKARRLERWFEEAGFFYSINPPELPPQHPIDAFVHDTRVGHCQLYATAMALMLRTQGVPTRVVSGYHGGEWDSGEEAYLVRANMAHLWVEVYFPDWGWVPFDPSPEDLGDGGTTIGNVRRMLSMAQLRSQLFWYRNIEGYQPDFRLEQLFGVTPSGLITALPQWLHSSGSAVLENLGLTDVHFLPVVLAILGLVGIYVWLVRQWRELRFFGARPRIPLTRDQIRAIRLYMKTVRRLRRNGTDCRGMTAGEILDHIEETDGVNRAAVAEILNAYNQVRFGGRTLDAERYRQLRQQLRRLRAVRTNN